MGWPSIVTEHNREYAEALDLTNSFASATSRQQRKLAGNGMDLNCIMSWYLYVFSNVFRKSKLQKLELPIKNVIDDSDDEGEEEAASQARSSQFGEGGDLSELHNGE